MPCDQIIENSIDLKVVNSEMLFDSLKANGRMPRRSGSTIYFDYNGYAATIRDGELTVRGMGEQGVAAAAAVIKRDFSTHVVKVGAKKFGWNVTVNPTAKHKLKIRHS